MRKWGWLIVTVALIIGICSVAGAVTFIRITTATTGGTYYPVGVGMATLWTEKLASQGIKARAMSSAGWVENVDIMRKHEAELGIMQGLAQVLAWEGKDMFKGHPYKELRSITALWPNVEHFVLVKSKVKTGTVIDIKGTHFCPGATGSGTLLSTTYIMRALGMTLKDIRPEFVRYNEAQRAILDGRLDGASLVGGPPVAAVTQLFAAPGGVKIKVLEFTDEQLKKVQKLLPFYFRYIIEPGTYPNQNEPIRSIAQPNWLAARKDVPADVVYKLTKTLWENLDYMLKVHKACKFLKFENALNGLTVPLHPGAYKYYKEKGLKIPDYLVPPELKK